MTINDNSKSKLKNEFEFSEPVLLTRNEASYSGGDGLDINNPVVITAESSALGVPAEYTYIDKLYGQEGKDWKLKTQRSLNPERGQYVDKFVIGLADGQELAIHFDISSFYGKF